MKLLCNLAVLAAFASPVCLNTAAVAATDAVQVSSARRSVPRLNQLMAISFTSPVSLHAMQSAPATQAKPPLPADIPLPDGPGKELTQRTCGTTCHSTDMFAKRRHDADGWSSIIDNMISNGLNASDDDLKTIRDYLTAHFGPGTSSAPASPAGGAAGASPTTDAPSPNSH